jgi:tetratricopeptide (TPR) repeat protein
VRGARSSYDREQRGRRGYGIAFGLSLVLVSTGVAWAVALLTPERARKRDPEVPPLESGDAFTIRNVAHIRPDAAAYAAFGEVDRAWRDAELARYQRAVRLEGPGTPWRPSAEQRLDDAVFLHTRDGRLAEAVALLDGWLRTHPSDVERHGAAAVLLAQLGRRDEAIAHRDAALRARPTDDALRADLARELAWSNRNAEAAVHWRLLVAHDPRDRGMRLALAQALAWSDAAAEAEPLLDALLAEAPADTSVRALLRGVRGQLEPTAEVAARWVGQDPGYLPYRVGYARALDRAGHPGADAWDRVLADTATVALLSEAAGSAAAIPDSIRSARLLGRAVALAPSDRSLRERWAEALAWSGDRPGAIREYGVLIAGRDDATLRLARGRLLVWDGSLRAGEADLERSAELAPSYEAFALLGDLLRWRGDYTGARSMYVQALALRPGDAAVLASLAATRDAERLARAAMLASAGTDQDAPGWALSTRYAEDNTGFLYGAVRVARAATLGRATVVGLAAEQRRIAQRFAHARSRWLTGYTFGVSASHDMGFLRLAGSGGLARHALVRDVPYGALSATLRRRGASLTAEASQTTAYEQLWAMRTLVDWEAVARFNARPMMARSWAVRGAMPIGRAGVEVSVERTRLGDGNARVGGTIAARAPIGGGVSAIYSGGALAYSEPAGAYWAPRRYDAHAAGIEYTLPLSRGVRVAARVMPGVVRADERARGVRGQPVGATAWSPQVTAGGDLVVERSRWSAAVSAGFGQGARGEAAQQGYRAMSGAVTLRARW